MANSELSHTRHCCDISFIQPSWLTHGCLSRAQAADKRPCAFSFEIMHFSVCLGLVPGVLSLLDRGVFVGLFSAGVADGLLHRSRPKQWTVDAVTASVQQAKLYVSDVAVFILMWTHSDLYSLRYRAIILTEGMDTDPTIMTFTFMQDAFIQCTFKMWNIHSYSWKSQCMMCWKSVLIKSNK